MRLPEIQDGERYVGLYVVDFGDHSGVGFTADEVAELLESEKFQHIKAYKIHNAYPDGRLELKGIVAETFQLEKGMFFYATDSETASGDYNRLVDLAVRISPQERAKVHLAEQSDGGFVTALIYPAEFDDEFSKWLLEGEYRTAGPAEGGVDAVKRYYEQAPQILERRQLFGKMSFESRTGDELLAATRVAVQR